MLSLSHDKYRLRITCNYGTKWHDVARVAFVERLRPPQKVAGNRRLIVGIFKNYNRIRLHDYLLVTATHIFGFVTFVLLLFTIMSDDTAAGSKKTQTPLPEGH